MLSRLIRGNAALYAHFGNVWVIAVAMTIVANLVAIAELLIGSAGPTVAYLILVLLFDALVAHACLHGAPDEPTQAEREAAYLAEIKHKAESAEALAKARREFNNHASTRMVMPRFDGTEL